MEPPARFALRRWTKKHPAQGAGIEVEMALLPAVRLRVSARMFAAGPAFGPTPGAGWVSGWLLRAVTANLLLTSWLANRALCPLASRFSEGQGRLAPAGPDTAVR